MRTIFLTMLMMLTLTACGGKNTAPETAANTDAANATVPEGDASLGDNILNIQFEPIGQFVMRDGTEIPLVDFKKIGKYYIYMTGKLDGRSSTVISLTRKDDMRNWAGIALKDRNNFVIVTRDEKKLEFTDARIFIGSDSHDSFTFITSGDNYTTRPVEVKKDNVSVIKLAVAQEEGS